jgi:hypothetical protein
MGPDAMIFNILLDVPISSWDWLQIGDVGVSVEPIVVLLLITGNRFTNQFPNGVTTIYVQILLDEPTTSM